MKHITITAAIIAALALAGCGGGGSGGGGASATAPTLPDLRYVVAAPVFDYNDSTGVVTLSYDIENDGGAEVDAAASTFEIKLYNHDTDDLYSTKTVSVSPLSFGGSTSATIQFDSSDIPGSVDPYDVTFRTVATIDVNGDVSEHDEENNEDVYTFVLTASSTALKANG